MAVEIERGADARMAKTFLCDLGMDASRQQMRSVTMTEIINLTFKMFSSSVTRAAMASMILFVV